MATSELPRVQVQSVTLTTSGARPLLINRDPSPGEVGIPIDSPLALELIDPGVAGIHDTNGRWDLLASLRAANLSELSSVLERVRLIKGIQSTETSIHLQTYRG